MDNGKILIVEDDHNLLDIICENLMRDGYTVETAVDSLQALDIARGHPPELIILDPAPPKLNGLEACCTLRKETSAPILLLTAPGNEKIGGMEPGSVDYLPKPFIMPELIARIHVMLQRAKDAQTRPLEENAMLKMGNLAIDSVRRRATVNGSPLELTPKGFDLLAYLARNRGIVFSRAQLLEKVWGYDFAGDTRTVDVHVRWLRKGIEEDPRKPQRLITVRRVGYKLEG